MYTSASPPPSPGCCELLRGAAEFVWVVMSPTCAHAYMLFGPFGDDAALAVLCASLSFAGTLFWFAITCWVIYLSRHSSLEMGRSLMILFLVWLFYAAAWIEDDAKARSYAIVLSVVWSILINLVYWTIRMARRDETQPMYQEF